MTTRMAWIFVGVSCIVTACTYTLPAIEASAVCGNGIVDDGESCDDGNLISGDMCDSNCTPSGCRNGIVTVGEECDDGDEDDSDDCTNACTVATCGDGIKKSTEACDDGNDTNGDDCDRNCTLPACGNGEINSPAEVCDDGNTSNGDDCNESCSLTGTSIAFIGSGTAGNDDKTGTNATVDGGHHMSLFGDKIYLSNNRAVRVIDLKTEEITTIAGNPNVAAGYMDAAKGTDALFRDIRGITTDGTTIWVSDVGNNVIRAIAVDPPHAVTTVAGTVVAAGTDPVMDGPATQAQIESARGLTYYNGVVYFVEANFHLLRSFNPQASTPFVTTLAGTAAMPGGADGIGPAARFRGPRNITADPIRNLLYISDTVGHKIRSYNVVSSEVKTLAGTGGCGYVDGELAQSQIHEPRGLALDGDNLYFVENEAHTLRQINLKTSTVSTLSGKVATCFTDCSCGMTPPAGGYMEGKPSEALWSAPYDMVFHIPSRSLFVSDGGNNRIRRMQ